MTEKAIKIHIDGPHTYGDLGVTGFVTDRTALEVGADFAEVLRARWPGSKVTVTLIDPTELVDGAHRG